MSLIILIYDFFRYGIYCGFREVLVLKFNFCGWTCGNNGLVFLSLLFSILGLIFSDLNLIWKISNLYISYYQDKNLSLGDFLLLD
jgi:hypothetical protein